MRLSRVVMLPFALVAGYIAYHMVVNYRYEWSYYLIPPILVIAACISLYPQIDAFGYRFAKPKEDPKLKAILQHAAPSFHLLTPNGQTDFITKALLQIRKIEWIAKKVEDVPTDIQVMCIYPGLLLQELFGVPLLKEYDRVVLYKHPFPSPAHKVWHSAEVHHEDGVVLFSLEQLINNYSVPGKDYHVGYDVWVRALLNLAPELGVLPNSGEVDASLFDRTKAERYLGLDDIPNPVAHWVCYLQDPKKYAALHSENHDFILEKMQGGQNPA